MYKKDFSQVSSIESISLQSFYAPLLGKIGPHIQPLIEPGTKTKNLLAVLTKEGFTPTIASAIKKSGLTVQGNIVLFDNDNISVFEYTDPHTATAEAIAYAQKYNKNLKQYTTWKGSTHIYVKDTIVVFYLGTRKNIIQSLTSFAGNSLIQ